MKAGTCCESPVMTHEHFAFRWGRGYSCFGGLFPSDTCIVCGTANQAFGPVRAFLFDVLMLVLPWDGAMCTGHGEQNQP